MDSIKNYQNHFKSSNSITSEKYFVITSGGIGQELINIIDKQLYVEKVFVFCFDTEKHRKWAQLHYKIKSVDYDINKIIESLQRHDYLLSCHDVDYKQAFHFKGINQFINYIEIDFILKLVCMNPKVRENSLREFKEFSIEYIGQKYINQQEISTEVENLKKILKCMQDQSENDTQIIKQYTEESFFYNMINDTLRGGDIIKIFFIRIGIYLLYSQLNNQAKLQKQKKITLYRGCATNKKEFELWEKEKTPFILQGFNFTSANKYIALDFAEKSLYQIQNDTQNDNIKILIEIEIDFQQQNQKKNILNPIAIMQFSEFQEDEYLMQLNTFLKVNQCQQEFDYVKVSTELSSLNMNQQHMNQIILDRKNDIDKILQINYSKEHFYLTNLLQKQNNGQKIKIIIDKLIADKNLTKNDYINVHEQYGKYYSKIGDYNKALENFFKSLEIQKQTIGQNNPGTATTFNNIGSVYDNQGEYNKALENYFKCLQIQKQTIGENNPAIATTYNDIGLVYKNQGEYNKALENFFKGLEIQKQTVGCDNPAISITFSNISQTYVKLGDNQKAIEFLTQSQKILNKSR